MKEYEKKDDFCKNYFNSMMNQTKNLASDNLLKPTNSQAIVKFLKLFLKFYIISYLYRNFNNE